MNRSLIDIDVLNGTILYVLSDTEGGSIWRSDGTPEGTEKIYPVGEGESFGASQLAVIGDVAYFNGGSNDLIGGEFWKTDGTTAGTEIVLEMGPGTHSGDVRSLVNASGTLYFTANFAETYGEELWRLDPGSDVATLVSRVGQNPANGGIRGLTAVGNRVFFNASIRFAAELFVSNGQSVSFVKDINSNLNSSDPEWLTDVGGTLYFSADNGSNGRELWRSDGTAAGTVMVRDIFPGVDDSWPSLLTNIDGVLYFAADDGVHGRELWKTDGTAAGTVMVSDVLPGPGSGIESQTERPAKVNGAILFVANDGVHGTELWRTDGTPEGTAMVKDIRSQASGSSPSWLEVSNDRLFFRAHDGIAGEELWMSDGTETGTIRVKDIWLGPQGSQPLQLTDVNGTLFFGFERSGGTELWKSDGTEAGTGLVKKFNAPGVGTITWPASVDGKLYFVANAGNGRELWRSDGTSEGTVEVFDLAPGSASSFPQSLVNVGGDLFFSATNTLVGRELWAVRAPVAGDYNGDSVVDPADYGMWRQSFGSTHELAADGNRNAIVDAADYVLWRRSLSGVGTASYSDVGSGSKNISVAVDDALGAVAISTDQAAAAVEIGVRSSITVLLGLVPASQAVNDVSATFSTIANAPVIEDDLLLVLTKQFSDSPKRSEADAMPMSDRLEHQAKDEVYAAIDSVSPRWW